MTEIKELAPLPPDNLSLDTRGTFIGAGYVYRDVQAKLSPIEVSFSTLRGSPVSPFFYNKPIENLDDPFLYPTEFIRDEQPREGYFPIAFVTQALRPPNHLYEVDDAIFMAVNRGTAEGPKWETRYFPKRSLDENVWNEALDLLRSGKKQEEIRTPDGLTLKQYTLDDAQEAFDLIDRNREHLSQYGDDTAKKYKTVEDMIESIVHPKKPKRMRFAIRNSDGTYVGSINLEPIPSANNPQRAEVGYYLGKEFIGKGYMKDALAVLVDFAFQQLGYTELFAKIHPQNIPSQKVITSAGFQETGKLKGDKLYSLTKSH